MLRLLNRGLNFSILPHKLDITQTLADFRKYERADIWHEYHYGKEKNNKEPNDIIFREEKTSLPKNYSIPEGLKVFLSAIKSEIQDPRNRNSVPNNLPEDEVQALKDIIRLQRERHIVVKACDKGAGVIVLNFDDYLRTCYTHLTSTQAERPYYSEVNNIAIEQAKQKIKHVRDEALEKEIISKGEHHAMIAENKNPGRFYCNLKIHKPHNHIPPPRPIISGSESITENIGIFREHHIKDVATKHKSFLQNTPHFLRIIKSINKGPRLPPKTIAFTMDATDLYTNIIHKEGLTCLENALNTRKNPKIPTYFLIQLMEIVLTENIFQFQDQLWRQEIGAAMGSRPVPHYANTFMAPIDNEIINISKQFNENNEEALRLLQRFLDDYFSLFVGSTKNLHKLLEKINKINPTIQLTMNHTSIENEAQEDKCSCPDLKAVPFLDTLITQGYHLPVGVSI